MTTMKVAALMRMALRDGRVIRLCDGGFVLANVGYGPEIFMSADVTFGVVGSMEPFTEGVGDEVPSFRMTFLPNSTASAAEIAAPGMQGSETTFWTVDLDPLTDLPIAAPQLAFDGQIDDARSVVGSQKRELDLGFVSTAERLFAANEGNSLNSEFHKSIYPGELGEDNATGLSSPVAWGIEAQGGGSAYYNYVPGTPLIEPGWDAHNYGWV